jgi:hypothetical protein
MTQADMNELIDRATRIALRDGTAYTESRAALDDDILGKLSVADCIRLRDLCAITHTIGAALILDLLVSWSV